jgi:hypothetical protein
MPNFWHTFDEPVNRCALNVARAWGSKRSCQILSAEWQKRDCNPAVTGAEMTAFVPHRPARPEKSEGGKTFKLVSEYEPAGDQPTAIKELSRASARRPIGRARPGAAGRHRLGQDLHHGEGDPGLQRPALILAPNKTLAAQLYAR